MREHVHRLHRLHAVGTVHQRQVARLRRRIAAHVDDPLRRRAQDHVDHRLVHPGPRRVEDDDVRMAVRRHEGVVQHRLHVPGVERRVADAVQFGVDLRVGDRLRNVLDAHDPRTARRAEVGDRPRPGIEVVERLVRVQVGELPRHLVELVGLRRVGLVEGLRAHLEAEPLHLLDDVVLAAVAHRIEVPDRVVELRIDDVEERRDLRETLREVVEQRRDARAVLRTEDHDHHHLARRGRADDQVAHQPRMRAGIVERIAVFEAEALGFEPDGVRRIGLQPAGADVEHLVEHVRDMEPHGRRSVERRTALHLLACQPAAVSKGEFQFVAVEARRRRTQAGGDLRELDLPDPGQLVTHLRRFEAQLLLIGQVLPFAAPAHAEVFAEGLLAQRRAFHIVHDAALHEAAALDADLHVHHIARNRHRDEDHHVVPTPHGLALGRQGRDFKPLDQGVVRFLSCHRFL